MESKHFFYGYRTTLYQNTVNHWNHRNSFPEPRRWNIEILEPTTLWMKDGNPQMSLIHLVWLIFVLFYIRHFLGVPGFSPQVLDILTYSVDFKAARNLYLRTLLRVLDKNQNYWYNVSELIWQVYEIVPIQSLGQWWEGVPQSNCSK